MCVYIYIYIYIYVYIQGASDFGAMAYSDAIATQSASQWLFDSLALESSTKAHLHTLWRLVGHHGKVTLTTAL